MNSNNRMELVIDGNASGVNSEIAKANAGLASFDLAAVRASKSVSSALEQIERISGRVAIAVAEVAIVAKTFGLAVSEFKALTLAAVQNQSAVGNVVDVYRAARLTMAGFTSQAALAGTAATVGLGLLAEKTISIANEQSKVIENNARIAASSKASFASVQAFSSASRVTGQDLSFLNAFEPDNVRDYVRELEKIQDPLLRAGRAQEVFGSDAAKIYPLLGTGISNVIIKSQNLADQLDGETRKAVQGLRDDLRAFETGNPFSLLRQQLRELVEEAKQGIVIRVAFANQGLKNLGNRLPGPALDGGAGDSIALQVPTDQKNLAPFVSNAEALRGIAGTVSGTYGAYGGGIASSQQLEQAKAIEKQISQSKDALESQLSATDQSLKALLQAVRSGGVLGDTTAAAVVQKAKEKAQIQLRLQGLEDIKKALDAEKEAASQLSSAYLSTLSPLEKIQYQLDANLRLYGLTPAAIKKITAASDIELSKENNKRFEEAQKIYRESESQTGKARLAAEAEALKSGLDLRNKTANEAAEYEAKFVVSRKELEIAQLEAVGARTLQEKLFVEQGRAAIEEKYIIERAAREADFLDQRTKLELSSMEAIARAQGVSEDAIALRRNAILEASGQKGKQLDQDAQNAIAVSQTKAQAQSIRLVQDATQKSFDDIKRSAGGLFDSLTKDTKGFVSTLGTLLKTALLTPLKEVFTNELARLLTPVLTNVRNTRPGGSPGIAGALLGGFTGQSSFAQYASVVGGPGGTGGFSGPLSGGNYGYSPQIIGANGQPIVGGTGGAGGLGQLGMLASAKGFLTQLGQLGATNKLFANGIYGAKGGALLGGGALLAADGLRRGGLVGTLETAAGGALIGAKFGGVYGAAIGAAVGLTAGLVRNMFKSANEKAREKIKSIYGVDISSKDILGQVVSIAKQSFGGDMDVAIRSSDVRDLVELYALSTGQSSRGIAAKMQPVTLSTSGGVTGILSNYVNGQAVSPITAGQAGPTTINVTLDGESSAAFLMGQTVSAIESSPRAVAGAAAAAQQSNFGRQQAAVSQLNPGLLLA